MPPCLPQTITGSRRVQVKGILQVQELPLPGYLLCTGTRSTMSRMYARGALEVAMSAE